MYHCLSSTFHFSFSSIIMKLSCSSSLLKEGAAAFASSALLLNNGASIGWSRCIHIVSYKDKDKDAKTKDKYKDNNGASIGWSMYTGAKHKDTKTY